jgi:hypothetical protein
MGMVVTTNGGLGLAVAMVEGNAEMTTTITIESIDKTITIMVVAAAMATTTRQITMINRALLLLITINSTRAGCDVTIQVRLSKVVTTTTTNVTNVMNVTNVKIALSITTNQLII